MRGSLVFRSLAPAVALSLGCGLQAQAATLRVPGQYPTIQQAIDASTSGDTVLVAPGTYVESLFISSKGDLALVSEDGPGTTVIDGGGASLIVCVASTEATCGFPGAGVEPEEADVDRGTPEDAADASADGAVLPPLKRDRVLRIAGFTFRNGNGGIFIRHCRAEIEDNVLTGIGRIHPDSSAIYASRISGSIRHNTVEDGFSGIIVNRPRELRIEDNVVTRNAWTAMEVDASYSATRRVFLLRNVITHNAWRGLVFGGALDILAEDNLVLENGSPSAENVLFANENTKDGPLPMRGRFVNNTIVGSVSGLWMVAFEGDVDELEFANNVAYAQGDQPAIFCTYDGHPKFHHDDAFSIGTTAVQGACANEYVAGEGDLSVDPRFAGDEGKWSKWRPAPDSPLIDAGSNEAARGLQRDFLFHQRVMDGGQGPYVDIGAFEYRARP